MSLAFTPKAHPLSSLNQKWQYLSGDNQSNHPFQSQEISFEFGEAWTEISNGFGSLGGFFLTDASFSEDIVHFTTQRRELLLLHDCEFYWSRIRIGNACRQRWPVVSLNTLETP